MCKLVFLPHSRGSFTCYFYRLHDFFSYYSKMLQGCLLCSSFFFTVRLNNCLPVEYLPSNHGPGSFDLNELNELLPCNDVWSKTAKKHFLSLDSFQSASLYVYLSSLPFSFFLNLFHVVSIQPCVQWIPF